jgi:hypothetical protein
MDTSYYHIHDPLENFKLRVIVRESARTVTGKESAKELAFHEDLNISWQEKLDGPVDILKRLSKDAPLSVHRCLLIREYMKIDLYLCIYMYVYIYMMVWLRS